MALEIIANCVEASITVLLHFVLSCFETAQVYNAYQALLSGLGTMLQVCHSGSVIATKEDYVILFIRFYQSFCSQPSR